MLGMGRLHSLAFDYFLRSIDRRMLSWMLHKRTLRRGISLIEQHLRGVYHFLPLLHTRSIQTCLHQ